MIETSPAIAPFNPAIKSIRPSMNRDTANAAITPAAAAKLVLTITCPIAIASAAVPRANCEPALNPNHPNHRMNTPRVTAITFDGGVGLALPSRRNLPSLGPSTKIPANAAQPPVLWTIVDPAKSWNPSWFSHPPPQVQAPING